MERRRTDNVRTRSFSNAWSDKRAPLSVPPWAASITTTKRGAARTAGAAGAVAAGGAGFAVGLLAGCWAPASRALASRVQPKIGCTLCMVEAALLNPTHR